MLWKGSLGLMIALLASCDDCDQEVRARPYYEARHCFVAEAEFVGCIAKGRSCPPVITVAVDEKGRCFALPDCLPGGFTRATAGGRCPTENLEACGDLASAWPNKSLQTDGRVSRYAPFRVRR
jgi:hypothetical protein